MPEQTEATVPTTWKERAACECKLSDPSAGVWPCIRLATIAIVGFVAFHLFYANGFDPAKDGASLGAFLLASGLIDIAKRFVATGDVVATAKPSGTGDGK